MEEEEESFDEKFFDQCVNTWSNENKKVKKKKNRTPKTNILETFTKENEKILAPKKEEQEDEMKKEKETKQEIMQEKKITNKEWLELNKEVFDKEQLLKDYESFIESKEEELLKQIISFTNPELSKKLFNQISNVNFSCFFKKLFSIQFHNQLSHNFVSNSENEDSFKVEDEKEILKNGRRVYPRHLLIDNFHEGESFYTRQLQDTMIGFEINSPVKIVSKLKEKEKIFSYFGIEMSQEGWIRFRNFLRNLIKEKNDQKILKFLYGVLGYGETLLLDSFQQNSIKLNKFEKRHLKDLREFINEIGNQFEHIEPIHKRITLIEDEKKEKNQKDIIITPKTIREKPKNETPKNLRSWEKVISTETSFNEELLDDKIFTSSKDTSSKSIDTSTKNTTDWKGYLQKDPKLIERNSLVPYLKKDEPINSLEVKKIFQKSNPSQVKSTMNFELEIGKKLNSEKNEEMKKLYQYLLFQTKLATKQSLESNLLETMFEENEIEDKKPSQKDQIDMFSNISKSIETDAKLNTRISYTNEQERKKFSFEKHPLRESLQQEDSKEIKQWDHNTFQLKKDYSKGELMEFSLGMNPDDIEKELKSETKLECLKILKELNIAIQKGDDELEEFTENNKISETRNSILQRVVELKKERNEKRIDSITRETIKKLEIEQTIKETKGEIDNERKKQIENLKMEYFKDKDEIYEVNPMEQARLEQLNISIKKNKNDDFQQLDQLLDQMNRELKRELFSSDMNIKIPNETKDLISKYSQMRNQYAQMERSNRSLRHWNSLTVKEKQKFEQEFRKSFDSSYKDIVKSIKNKMEGAQFAETLTFISLAIENQKEKDTEIMESLKLSFKEEEEEIIQVTNDFYLEIEKRYKIKEKSRLSNFGELEKEIYKMRNEKIEIDDVFKDYSIIPRHFNFNQIKFLSKELTEDELVSLIQLQTSIQQKKILERKKLVKNEKLDKEDIDPLISMFKLKSFQYLTFEQKLFYKNKFQEIYNKKMENWKQGVNKKQLLTISPNILKKHFQTMKNLPKIKNEKNENFTPNWSLNEWKKYLNNERNINNSLHKSLFPEKPWDGDFHTLQMLYLSLQLERSHLPQYTRSALEINDGEGFLLRSFWRGVFMMPESLSNFIYVRPKPEVKLIKKQVEDAKVKKKKEKIDAPKVEPPPKIFVPPPKRMDSGKQIPPPAAAPIKPIEIPPMPKIQIPDEITPRAQSRSQTQAPTAPPRIPDRTRRTHTGVDYESDLWKALQKRLFDIELNMDSIFNDLIYSKISFEVQEQIECEKNEKIIQRVKEIIEEIKKSKEEIFKIPLSMLTVTIPEDDIEHINNVLFYQGKLKAQPIDKLGLTIDEIHENWFGDYEKLEENHDYIQWLFPNREGGMNLDAQPLSKHEAQLFKESDDMKQKVVKSYEMMLDFYGMKLDDESTGKISRNEKNYKERYDFLDKSEHNYLRISRILRFLGIIQLENFKIEFLRFLITETLSNLLITNCVPSLIQYWLPTVIHEEDLEDLETLIFQKTKRKVDRKQFFVEEKSWSFNFQKKKETPEMIKQRNEMKRKNAKEKANEMKKKKKIENILKSNEKFKKSYEESLICRKEFNSQELLINHPPIFYSKNKQFLFNLVSESKFEGILDFSRYKEMKFPEKLEFNQIDVRYISDFYNYNNLTSNDNEMNWWVNFADEYLFCGYSLELFAQDEIMVAEHPILSCLKESLDYLSYKNVRYSPYTSQTKNQKFATPILIQNVERKLEFNTSPTEDNKNGIYGNHFKNSSFEQIKKVTTIIEPSTYSNIVSIEAPRPSKGIYTKQQITYALGASYTGFYSAKLETYILGKESIVIHTGDWGTGAFGGNKILMYVIQILSAQLVGINYLVFHSKSSLDNLENAKKI
eukprot:gene1778-547_t